MASGYWCSIKHGGGRSEQAGSSSGFPGHSRLKCRAGESVQGGSAHQAPPLRVVEGPCARLGVAMNRGPLGPQGRYPGVGHLPPCSPRRPLDHSSLADLQPGSKPQSDCERSGLPVCGHTAVGPRVPFLAGWVPCSRVRAFLPVWNTLFLSSLYSSSKTTSLTPNACPERPETTTAGHHLAP